MPRSVKEAYHPESDLVVGKGKGLIMLFHGPPGLGKTSTAECLAAYAHKPLFPITAADIGTTPQEVEMSLQTIFGLSQRWECILLFDEADIILQARDRDNFGRNAIVTVFLRTLEYYSGILIMTTNRVGIVDEAFKSRIHVTLYFPKLDLESFLMIWQTALQRLRYDKDIDIDEKRIMRFAREVWKRSKDHPMNGRDIQNTIQSAVALAEFDAKNGGGRVTLAPQHIDPVLKMSDDFNKYLTAVHGVSDSEQARLSGDRDDEADWESSTFLDEASSVPLYTTSRRALGPNDPDRDSGYRSSSRWYE
ncbi:P-loop containing nucleoside triphosphate hydrolase protein [Nemania sp. FL0916]|nr:P-loop containing nucleoside triphosphate hydrolase protein [Nemania sp. FL0916]